MNEITRNDYHFNRWTYIDTQLCAEVNMFCVQKPFIGSSKFNTILSFRFQNTGDLNLFWNQFNEAVHQCDQVTDCMDMRDIYNCVLSASVGLTQKSREQIINKLEYML